MRRDRFLVVLTLISAGAASADVGAAPGKVLRSLPAPGSCSTGLTYGDGLLWVADHKADTITAVDPHTGRRVRSFPSPGHRPAGLAAAPGTLWHTDTATGRIYGLDPRTGFTKISLEAPVSAPVALAWTGKHLWLAARRNRKLRLIDTDDGTTIRTLPVPGRSADALAWDGRYLWVADRLADKLYVVDPRHGEVLFAVETPGPHVTGLAFDGKHLWVVDYQTDRLTRIVRDDGVRWRRVLKRRQAVELTIQVRNYGPSTLGQLDVYLALPGKHPTFDLTGKLRLLLPGARFLTDRWGQRVAHHRLRNVAGGKTVNLGWKTFADLFDVRYFPYPHKIGPLHLIPAKIRRRYLADGAKYRLRHPAIQKAVKAAVGREKNPYWMARKIYRYVHEKMYYKLAGGWNVAPRVLARGSGSCSEYSFVFIALCRAAGIPARYVGAVVVRRDAASWDDVYHRWVEIYLPGFGWLPVDPSRGDKKSEAERGDAFHHLTPDFLVTTQGGGGSKLLRWTYNYDVRWTCKGRCLVKQDAIAEWSPLNKKTSRRGRP